MKNLKEINKLLNPCDLWKLNQEDINNSNRTPTSNNWNSRKESPNKEWADPLLNSAKSLRKS